MKKIVVMSDNHGSAYTQDMIKETTNADYYVHCGDSELRNSDLEGWIAVRGNNDWIANLEKFIVLQVEDVCFYICHGERFGYFNRENQMIKILQKNNCTVMLSGHTHMPTNNRIDDYTFINPGSTNLPRGGSVPSYCIIEVDGKKINVKFIEI